jgi:hypothetical protein
MSHHSFFDCLDPDNCYELECWQRRIERIITQFIEDNKMSTAALATAIAALQAQYTAEDSAVAAAIAAETGALNRLEASLAAALAAIPPDNTAAIAAVNAVVAGLATHVTNLNAIAATANAADPAAPPPPALATTTTTLTLSSTSPTAGSDLQLLVVVDETPAGAVPTGAVTFSDAGTVLGTGTLDNTGAATFDIPSIAAGAHAFTAAYGGDSANAASTSSEVDVTV